MSAGHTTRGELCDLEDQTPHGRPYYLTGPCPPWCAIDHADDSEWAYEDRYHRGEGTQLELTAMPMIVDTAGPALARYVPRITACLEAHYREAEPRICLVHGEMTGEIVSLTLGEASRLAAVLAGLAAAGRGDG